MPEAIAAYRKAADKGNTSAMVELGVLYGTGAGVPKDDAEARKLFARAAEAGNPRGVTNLAALSKAAARRRIRSRPEASLRKRRRQIRRKRSISSD